LLGRDPDSEIDGQALAKLIGGRKLANCLIRGAGASDGYAGCCIVPRCKKLVRGDAGCDYVWRRER